jgi:hypothetical protein
MKLCRYVSWLLRIGILLWALAWAWILAVLVTWLLQGLHA